MLGLRSKSEKNIKFPVVVAQSVDEGGSLVLHERIAYLSGKCTERDRDRVSSCLSSMAVTEIAVEILNDQILRKQARITSW
jgi:hypothetical protein